MYRQDHHLKFSQSMLLYGAGCLSLWNPYVVKSVNAPIPREGLQRAGPNIDSLGLSSKLPMSTYQDSYYS